MEWSIVVGPEYGGAGKAEDSPKRLTNRWVLWSSQLASLTLIGKSDVEKRGAQNSKGESGMNTETLQNAEHGQWRPSGGRIGRSTTHRSVGQGGIALEKTLRSPCLRACATGRISMRLSVSGQSSHQP